MLTRLAVGLISSFQMKARTHPVGECGVISKVEAAVCSPIRD